MRVITPGHLYELAQLDGAVASQLLRFVRRVGPGYPGNDGEAHPGATTQEVLRALIDRTKYVREQARQLGDQQSVVDDSCVLHHLREALWVLEARAARRDGRRWTHLTARGPMIEDAPTCDGCGHVGCEERSCGR